MSKTAHDVLAFLIVECNVPLPYAVALELTGLDPLFKAIHEAWEAKVYREQQGTALLASAIYNSQGAKTKPSDFLPKRKLTPQEEAAALKAKIQEYNQAVAGVSSQ